MNDHIAVKAAQNHSARAMLAPFDRAPYTPIVVENVITEAPWRMNWASLSYFVAMASTTGRTIYIPAPVPAPQPIHSQGALTKAVERTRRESGC